MESGFENRDESRDSSRRQGGKLVKPGFHQWLQGLSHHFTGEAPDFVAMTSWPVKPRFHQSSLSMLFGRLWASGLLGASVRLWAPLGAFGPLAASGPF